MKIYINRLPVRGAWGGGNNFTRAFHEMVPKMGHEIVDPQDYSAKPDVILCVGLSNDGQCIGVEQAIMYKMVNPNVKVILRVNENDARKATTDVDRGLIEISRHLDGAVFVSQYMADYFKRDREWHCKDSIEIINGVDREVFKPGEKLNNGKVNLLMSHWSDNPMKGQDYAEWIDDFVSKRPDEFTFTYIGRTKANFKHSKHIPPLSGKRLGEELGKYDVCINASRHDPGPNSVIEPITCGLPTYVHVDGGGGVEFAGKDHTFSSFEELECLLTGKQFSPNRTSFQDWRTCINQFVGYLENVCGRSTG